MQLRLTIVYIFMFSVISGEGVVGLELIENHSSKSSENLVSFEIAKQITGLSGIKHEDAKDFKFVCLKDEEDIIVFKSRFLLTEGKWEQMIAKGVEIFPTLLLVPESEHILRKRLEIFSRLIIEGENIEVKEFYYPDFKNYGEYMCYFSAGESRSSGRLFYVRKMHNGFVEITCLFRKD